MEKRFLRKPAIRLFKLSAFLAVILLFKINCASAQLISNISVSTGHQYATSVLNTNVLIYTDRTYRTTMDVPSYLINAPFIKTPNDDKASKSSVSFKLSQNATVYIGYDPRATALPAWLSTWQKLPEVIGITDPNITHFDIYSKTFAAGTVTLGGNVASPAAAVKNMSIIIAVATPGVKTPPFVNITSPGNNASLTGSSITINASASDLDGSVTNVDFYQGANLIGSDNTLPYSFTWNNVAPGNYSLTAKATDNDGLSTVSSPVAVALASASSTAPVIFMVKPSKDTTFTTAPVSFHLIASATAFNTTINKVEFFNGSTLLNTQRSSPYDFNWQSVPIGTYIITAKATDNKGLSTTSAPITIVVSKGNTPPTVSLTNPANNATFLPPASITIEATAADPGGSVAKVDFYNGTTFLGSDNTSPYSFTWSGVGIGNYTLTAKATDNLGLVTTSASRTVSVINSTNPAVSLTIPGGDTTYTTAPVSVRMFATAKAFNSTIAAVEFYNGTTLLNTQHTSPFDFTWTNVGAGTYTITVKAIDANGLSSVSAGRVVSVRPHPSVVSVNPADKATNVDRQSSVTTNVLKLPNAGIDNNTLTSANVFLTENATGTLVPSNVNGTGGGDAIILVPTGALKANTVYKFTVTAGVKDLTGSTFVPFTSTFTTNSATVGILPIQFEKVALPTTVGRHTCVTIGPDGKLYALADDGLIKRYTINSNGTLSAPQLIYSLQDSYGTRQKTLSIGLTFDPSSTASNLIAWVSHCNTYTFTNAPDWDDRITKLSGTNLQNVQNVVINLPRSAKDHVTNSIAFGPDGALYYTQGSTSAMGQADQTWNLRNEHLLNAAVLRLDLTKLGALPLDAKTPDGGGTYNPYAPNAPLTIYASGVRNSYDLVWHSNGNLYAATNGSAAGGNTPASVAGTLRPDGSTYNGPKIPALTNVQQTQEDFLYRIVKGGYYGHPNPLRGEYVMNGGNPTSGKDKAEVPAYPVGTLPDVNWRGNIFDFKNNVSPNGFIEYKSNTFNGALKGKLLVVRYSAHDDIITLTPGTNNDISGSVEGASIPGFTGFVDPLDITEDVRNGNLYVSEYGGDSGKITLLRPTSGMGRSAARINSVESSTSSHPVNTLAGCDADIDVAITEDKNPLLLTIQKPRISPNPLQKKFNILFPASYQGEYTLQIIDILGQVYQMGKTNIKGGTSMAVDISRLSLKAGTYFLKLISENNQSELFKLVVKGN